MHGNKRVVPNRIAARKFAGLKLGIGLGGTWHKPSLSLHQPSEEKEIVHPFSLKAIRLVELAAGEQMQDKIKLARQEARPVAARERVI